MDISAIIAALIVISTAAGGWFQGRKTGLGNALTTASDVVGMLSAQVGEQRAQLAVKDAQIEQLRAHIATLEGHPPSNE